MMPVLFKLPVVGWNIPGYGLALMIGFLLSIIWAARRAARSGADPDVILNCGFVALIGGVIGSRAMYVVHYWEQFAYRGSAWQVFTAIIDVRKGGLEVYGGVVAVALFALVYLWRSRLSIRWYLDIIAPSAALGMGLGRIGCFLNGCCWGGVCTEVPWSMRFPFGSGPSVQQWTDRVPGAGLPEELLYFAPPGAFAEPYAAQPITRDIHRISENEMNKVQEAARAAAAELVPLNEKLNQAQNPEERERLREQLRLMRRRQVAALTQNIDVRTQMKKHGLSLAELKELARQHPSLPVHPAQLYSAITLCLLAVLLSAVYWRRTRDGQVICTMFLVEPWTRWLIEVVRPDNPVDIFGVFTISQFLAICLTVVALIGFWWLRRQPPRSPRARLWVPPEETAAKGKKATASS